MTDDKSGERPRDAEKKLTYKQHIIIMFLYIAVYQRFEDLPVWQEAARLYNLALDLLEAHNVRLGPGWRLQFERATLSVSSNIAEGFERLTSAELRSFLVI
jgi:hypothetical protein